jgi:hypothetical protein
MTRLETLRRAGVWAWLDTVSRELLDSIETKLTATAPAVSPRS